MVSSFSYNLTLGFKILIQILSSDLLTFCFCVHNLISNFQKFLKVNGGLGDQKNGGLGGPYA